MEHSESLNPKFEAIGNLIKAMVNVTKCIVEFKELPPQYIAAHTAVYDTADALIPTAAYWIIRSILACALQIAGLISMSYEYVILFITINKSCFAYSVSFLPKGTCRLI